jgi:formamidopyrimidine-DNA glycosylase
VSPDALDPLDDNPTWMEFGRFLADANGPLKLVLTDPTRIAGLGPVYSDEILWEAGCATTTAPRRVHPGDPTALSRHAGGHRPGDEGGRIVAGRDEANAAIDDEGEAAEHLKVYGRAGLPCSRCRKPIVRTRIKKGIYTYHCEQCMI